MRTVASMSRETRRPLEVLIAGAGPGALEAALALQRLAAAETRVTLLAPEPAFTYRPLAVAEPFGLAHAVRFSLPRLAAERGFAYIRDALASVDVAARRVRIAQGAVLPYDALLVAVGARAQEALPGALTFGGPRDAPVLRSHLERLERNGRCRVAFVAAPSTAW